MKYSFFPQLLFLLILAVLLWSGCARFAIPKQDRTLDEKFFVERSGGKYTLHFDEKKEWKVYAGYDHQTQINWDNPYLTVNGNKFSFAYNPEGPRMFFGVVDNNKAYIASERKILLTDTPNFRDLGGIVTEDDRIVSWGLLYRSGSLNNLGPNDFRTLNQLGIKTICDFRNDIETTKKPNVLPNDILYEQLAVGGKEGAAYADLVQKVRKEKYRRTQIRDLFVDIMTSFADSATEDFKPVIDHLLNDPKDPLVFHCAGGKDRTGFMAAIILSALNVDRKTIKQEYLMSNFYRLQYNRKRARLAKLIFYDNETIGYGLMVHEAYIDAVFKVMDDQYGGVDNYLEEKFGLDAAKRQQLIENYTTKMEVM